MPPPSKASPASVLMIPASLRRQCKTIVGWCSPSFGLDDSSELEAERWHVSARIRLRASVLMIPASLRRCMMPPLLPLELSFGLDDSSELEAGRERRCRLCSSRASVLMIPASLRRKNAKYSSVEEVASVLMIPASLRRFPRGIMAQLMGFASVLMIPASLRRPWRNCASLNTVSLRS